MYVVERFLFFFLYIQKHLHIVFLLKRFVQFSDSGLESNTIVYTVIEKVLLIRKDSGSTQWCQKNLTYT